jgi:transcriptional regulator with XRE-family HTH domain
MLRGDRVRELRKERGWSQGDLGSRIGTDAGRISRYEAGKITPSLEALVRLADVLEVSVDYLVRENSPRKILEGHNLGRLGQRLADVAELPEADQDTVAEVIDAVIAKSRLKALAGGLA